MGIWKQIKTILSGQKPEQASDSYKDKAETIPESATTPDHMTAPRPHAEAAGRQAKKISSPFVKPTLFFSGWGYDERSGLAQQREQGKDTHPMEVGGQAFVLRKWNMDIVFRERGDTDERAALIITTGDKEGWNYILSKTPPQKFAEAIAQWQYGRCLLYVADNMTPAQCAYLCFTPSGDGFALDEYRMRIATFHWKEATTQKWAELLTADPEQLRPLCKRLFDTQINPHSRNPYIDTASLEQIPHRFLKGSEEELRRLTIAIVQTDRDFFKEHPYPVTIKYRAQTPTKRAGMTRITMGKLPLRSKDIPGRITSLCDLALRTNTFVGVEWKALVPASKRLSHWEKDISKVHVTVHPPSAHERAESLLVLADWLQGKVREEKRLRLLGIEE